MRAIIALALLFAVAIASSSSGLRGGDLGAARRSSEIPVAKTTPSAPDVVADPAEPEPHIRAMVTAFLDAKAIATELPGPTMAAVCDVLDALCQVVAVTRELGEDNSRTLLQPLQAAALTCLGKFGVKPPGRPTHSAQILKTPREYRTLLLKLVPHFLAGLRKGNVATLYELTALAIMKGSTVNEGVAKLTYEGVRSNLQRNLAVDSVPVKGTPEEVLEAVLKAAGLPPTTVDNIVDGGARMRKLRAARKKAKAHGKS